MAEHLAIKKRYSVKISGEAGQGLNVSGSILSQALRNSGYHTFEYREYPSLIHGGYTMTQIDIADVPIASSMKSCNVLVCLSRRALHEYLPTVLKDGIVLHAVPKVNYSKEDQEIIEKNNLQIHYIDAYRLSQEIAHTSILVNMIFMGLIWKLLGQKYEPLADVLRQEFADKPQFLESDLTAAQIGYDAEVTGLSPHSTNLKSSPEWKGSLLMEGNRAIALGAIAAGVRVMYGYPMTPSTSIIEHLSSVQGRTGMIVKQAEDEITASQMAIGSMFMGTRALTATSGGGFDLMTESVSLAGMTETPFVCVLAQRPGPSTGLPTWTAQGDLNLAVYAGHGEFPRCVLAVSNPEDAFSIMQDAFNLAERYQIPVIVLTDKQIAESNFSFRGFPQMLSIERGLVPATELGSLQPAGRYRLTESGISPRWLPGSSSAAFVGNSDEHGEDGSLTEEAVMSREMMAKRMRKQETLAKEVPEPRWFGPEEASVILVGWGSVRNSVLDALEIAGIDAGHIAYVHYSYLWPLRTEMLERAKSDGKKLVLVENNYQGQLGSLIKQAAGIEFDERLFKYDGRPFFVDEILDLLARQ